MSENSVSGYIYDIQPYSVHDGPGIRTLIFLKGCPLNCQWCSNPESIFPYPQLRFFSETCKNDCSDCIYVCPSNAIFRKDEQLKIDFSICKKCDDKKCISACKKNALQICGYEISVDELVKRIEKDIPFFGEEGGITLSGGEPFLQADFIYEVLKQCKIKGISTAVESCMNVPFESISKCLQYIDFFMFDIKIISETDHINFCNSSNKQIIKNIEELTKIAAIPLLPRFPLIPGLTDDDENILNISNIMKKYELKYLNVLPYMKLGTGKYEQIGKNYNLNNIQPPSKNRVSEIIQLFRNNGISCI